MSVTRYDLACSDCYGVEMEESINGDYVEYDDYAKLEAKCDTENYIANTLIRKLEAERDRLRELVVKAYEEAGDTDELTREREWLKSKTRTALQETGDESLRAGAWAAAQAAARAAAQAAEREATRDTQKEKLETLLIAALKEAGDE